MAKQKTKTPSGKKSSKPAKKLREKGTAHPKGAKDLMQKLKKSLAEKPVSRRGASEVIPLFVKMAEIARRDGILALEEAVTSVDDPVTRLGMELMIDGTHANVIEEVLNARKGALVKELERKIDIIRTAIVAMQHGDHPRVVKLKCGAFLPF